MVARTGGEGNGGLLLNGVKFLWGAMKMFRKQTEEMAVQHTSAVKATELFPLKWFILCYVNFTSI